MDVSECRVFTGLIFYAHNHDKLSIKNQPFDESGEPNWDYDSEKVISIDAQIGKKRGCLYQLQNTDSKPRDFVIQQFVTKNEIRNKIIRERLDDLLSNKKYLPEIRYESLYVRENFERLISVLDDLINTE